MTLTLHRKPEVYKSLVVALLAAALVYFVSGVSSGTYVRYNFYVNPINPPDTGYIPGYKNTVNHAFTK